VFRVKSRIVESPNQVCDLLAFSGFVRIFAGKKLADVLQSLLVMEE
jgi:hypothetical protein